MTSPIIEAKLWRCDYVGNHIEDISDVVIEGRVDMNPDNDQTWQFDCIMTWEGYSELAIYTDWLSPELIVTWPNGVVRRDHLGLYFLLESPINFDEEHAEVHVRAMDPLWLIARQGFTGKLLISKNTDKARVVRDILDGAVLTENPQGKQRFAIPKVGGKFKKELEYPRTDSRLAVVNEVLQGMGCYNLWTNKLGIMVTKEMGEARLSRRTPVKTYSAHVPSTIELTESQKPIGGVVSEVIGTIDTSPFDESLINEIIMVNDDPDSGKVSVKRKVKNPKNPRRVFKGKKPKKSKKVRNFMVDDDATALKVAEALLDELSSKNRTARITVLPDPVPDFARETIDCYIWDANGREVALGQYAVHSVTYGFTPDDATMTIDAGRIDEVDGALEDDDD
jgi:hypothetical protein